MLKLRHVNSHVIPIFFFNFLILFVLQFENGFCKFQNYSNSCIINPSQLLIYLLPLSAQSQSLFSLKEKKKNVEGGSVEPWRVLHDITWGKQRDWNREGKQRVWNCAPHFPALLFRINGRLSEFLPSYLPFHTVYKYWQCLL